MAAPWFAVEEISSRTWLIAEPGHVNCFVIEGDDRAVLVDTGLGIADIEAAVCEITDRPVLVVNTHSHTRHRGGNWQFAEVAAHPLGEATLTTAVLSDELADYVSVAQERVDAYERIRGDDQRYFHLFTDATAIRRLPPEAYVWQVPAGPPPLRLADRQLLELGGRALTVLFTPGHSPDSLCLLDEHDGLLFAGDTLITGDFRAHTADTELELYAGTLRALDKEFGDSLRAIHPAHASRYRAEPRLLRAAADAFEAILGGSRGEPWTDLAGRPVLRHGFVDFAVLTPPA